MAHPWVTAGRNRVRFATGYAAQALMAAGLSWTSALGMVQAAEELGFDGYWAYDHPNRGLDCWTFLSAAAVSTRRIRLGSLVSCAYYRSPAMLARCAADVDRMSSGRLVLGVGSGDDAAEAAQLGTPLPPVPARLRAVEETVRIVRGLWRGAPFTFAGDQFAVRDATLRPGPVQSPHVPLLVAGGGEKVTLRQVARYADVSNFGSHEWAGSAFGAESVRKKLDVLRRHCEAVGRDDESILKSFTSLPVVVAETPSAVQRKLAAVPEGVRTFFASSTVAGTPREVIDYYRPLIRAGIRYVIACVMWQDVESLRLLAEHVVPELQPG